MIKSFKHRNFPVCNLETKDVNGSRWYILPNGKLVPSVTTVLSYFDADSIQKWKDRVGEEESNRVRYRATTRGTAIHSLIESYLNNSPQQIIRPDLQQTFADMRPALDRIDNIYCQESVLYSDRVAGRTDVIGDFDGVPSIIDFKTSKKTKQEKYITNYKEQTSIYGSLFKLNTGINIDQAVIIIGVDDEPEPQIFKLNKKDMDYHTRMFETKLQLYWGIHNAKSS